MANRSPFGGSSSSGRGTSSPYWNVSSSSSSPTGSGASLGSSYAEYQKLFPAPSYIDTAKLPKIDIPKINVPRITPAVVSTPANLAARLDTIYAPRMSELQRAQELQDRQIASAAAAAGLGDSGVALGARQVAGEAFGREREALIGQKASDQLNVEFQTLMINAQNRQQASLAQAQLDTNAQVAYAQAVLAGKTAESQNYLNAIGINAEIASAYRDSFLSYFNTQEQLAIQRDAQLQQFNASLLDAMLKQAGLELEARNQQANLEFEREKLAAVPPQPQAYVGPFAHSNITGTTTFSNTRPAAYTPPRSFTSQFPVATGSPTLSRTGRIFASAPTSLGIGGL